MHRNALRRPSALGFPPASIMACNGFSTALPPRIGMNADTELNKLRWRCRRGMMELDALLGRWLEREWRQSPSAEREVFLTLLEREDDTLWRWLSGLEEPADDDLAALVARIRGLSARP